MATGTFPAMPTAGSRHRTGAPTHRRDLPPKRGRTAREQALAVLLAWRALRATFRPRALARNPTTEKKQPDEDTPMSNGNGVAVTLTHAAETVAETAKDIGRKVASKATSAVTRARKTAAKAEKAVSTTAGKARKAVTTRVAATKKRLAKASS